MRSILIVVMLLSVSIAMAQEGMYDICPVKNSEELPEAFVYNTEGKEVNLKEYVGVRKAVLVFYRGGWCPYCMRHLSALQEVKEEMDELGYELIAITPDNFNRLDSSFKRSGGADYQLFSDKDVDAINAFGIGWKVDDELYNKYKDKYNLDTEWWSGETHHILPVPAVFIVNNGIISVPTRRSEILSAIST